MGVNIVDLSETAGFKILACLLLNYNSIPYFPGKVFNHFINYGSFIYFKVIDVSSLTF